MNFKRFQYFIFLLIFIISLDFAFGRLLNALYFSEKSTKNDRLIHSVIGTQEDILIFGSSRAIHHYNPRIIEDSLEMSCYNVGSNGQNIYFHLALLKSALERYEPKIVILELMSIDFEKTPSQWNTERLGELLPFSKQSRAAEDAVLLRSERERIKLLSAVYPFNSLLYSMLRNNFIPFNNHTKGFIPINRTWSEPIKETRSAQIEVDTNKMKAIHQFIQVCKKNDIQLFVFVSPHYAHNKPKSEYIDISEELLCNYGLIVHNFENDSEFLKHPEYFADPLHLNKTGANIYTALIVRVINQGYFKQISELHN